MQWRLLKKGAGKHFDPNLVEVFLNELGAIRRIYEL
jgi:response regulator RpfG family c-di-GMP phosphodiesterase